MKIQIELTEIYIYFANFTAKYKIQNTLSLNEITILLANKVDYNNEKKVFFTKENESKKTTLKRINDILFRANVNKIAKRDAILKKEQKRIIHKLDEDIKKFFNENNTNNFSDIVFAKKLNDIISTSINELNDNIMSNILQEK